MSDLLGPLCPPEVWLSEPVQTDRKEQFLEEEGWEVLFQGRQNDETPEKATYLIVKRNEEDANVRLGLVATRYLFMSCGYLDVAHTPGGILSSGQWTDHQGQPTLEELIENPYVALGDELDSWEGVKQIRPEFWLATPEPPTRASTEH
jgi:hypothetical protein